MRRVIVFLFFLVFATSCSAPSQPSITYQPDPNDVDLEGWAETYPQTYKEWADSVHGEAYLDGNMDAPTCNDCHDDPDSGDIQTITFRLEIPNRCARCHDDTEMMAGYDIAADVYDTYIADYHGTTIAYYQATGAEVIRDEAVCSDCHDSHAVYPVEDEHSTVSEVNLQKTCQTCHSDASDEFVSAYGHYRPIRSPVSSADSTIVFVVKLFYQAMIPITLGGMLGYIALDLRHRFTRPNTSPKIKESDNEESHDNN